MRKGCAKFAALVLIGLAMGGLAGRAMRSSRAGSVSVNSVAPAFDAAVFAKAGLVDSGVALARQLPFADAEKCAELAKAMLLKRVRVKVMEDPFATLPSETYEDLPLPQRAWEGLFKRWLRMAPDVAWEFVLANHRDDIPLRAAALHQWAMFDPMAAVQAAGEGITLDDKKLILRACVENDPATGLLLLKDWGAEMLDSLELDPFDSSESLAGELLRKFAEKAPQQAMEWCKEHAPNEVDSVCAGWMRQDDDACLAWIASLEIFQQKNLLADLCKEAEVSSKTVRVLAGLCEPAEILDWVDTGLNSIAKRDTALAQTLIDDLLPNPTDRMLARYSIAEELVNANPRKAMEFLLPSLRTALPLYSEPTPHFSGLSGVLGYDEGPDFYGVTDVWEKYLNLGPAAGVGKAETLALLREIHPQYHALLLGATAESLQDMLGPPGEWAFPFLRDIRRESLSELVPAIFESVSPEQAWRDLKSLAPGTLRDVMFEHYLSLMIEDEAPIDVVLARASESGSSRLDLSGVYDAWMNTEPTAALRHLVSNPDAKASEWSTVISSGFNKHAEEIQDAVERMPAGALRRTAVESLASSALRQGDDIISSVYWATEIADRTARYKQMREIWEHWQGDERQSNDPKIAEAVRLNLQNSALDAQEKALWLERMESEGLR